jgi:hypothetical protein
MNGPDIRQMTRFFCLIVALNISAEEFEKWLDELTTIKILPTIPASLPKNGLDLHERFPKSKIREYTSEKGMVQRTYNFFLSVSDSGVASSIEELAISIKNNDIRYKNLGVKTRKVVLDILKDAGYL